MYIIYTEDRDVVDTVLLALLKEKFRDKIWKELHQEYSRKADISLTAITTTRIIRDDDKNFYDLD